MNRVRSVQCSPLLRVVPLALLCLLIVGCGSRLKEVSGTVRYDGKPLSSGIIQFLGQDGIPRSGTIQPDGSFAVPVPEGETKVIVSCVDDEQLKRVASQQVGNRGRSAAPTLPNKNPTLIPLRYADWNASGLTIVVESDKTSHDFALTSR